MSASVPIDVFSREAPSFVVCSDAGRGPTIVCISSTDIPCHLDEFGDQKSIQVDLLIVGIDSPGWSKVPYANVNGRTVMGENPKPLAEFGKTADGAIDKNKLQCYGYLNKKGKPMDKGARVDGTDAAINGGNAVSYTLEVGMIIRLWIKKTDMPGGAGKNERKGFFPEGVNKMRAGERLVVSMACKGWDRFLPGDHDADGDEIQTNDLSPCCRGYGVGVVGLRLASGTLLSDLPVIQKHVPATAAEMRMIQNDFVTYNDPIRQAIQTENVFFMVSSVDSSAYCAFDEENQLFKIMGVGEACPDPIDVQDNVLLDMCNTTDRECANALLDIAIAMGAVSFLCYSNEFRGRSGMLSRVTGIPIIDARKMLASVDASALAAEGSLGSLTFPTPAMIGDEGERETVSVSVSRTTQPVDGETLATCPEMSIIGKGVKADRAYAISFIGESTGVLWSGYWNASKPSLNTRGAGANALQNAANAAKFARKRWGNGEKPVGEAPAEPAAAAEAKQPKKKAKKEAGEV